MVLNYIVGRGNNNSAHVMGEKWVNFQSNLQGLTVMITRHSVSYDGLCSVCHVDLMTYTAHVNITQWLL